MILNLFMGNNRMKKNPGTYSKIRELSYIKDQTIPSNK